MTDLAAELHDLPPRRGEFPWAGHEYVKGWGVMALPFDSGHVLALRVFPENDFAPYRAVWHRSPDGSWSIYVDGPRLDTACPRYYGPACVRTGFARITLTWTGPRTLQVELDRPALRWSLEASETPALRILNRASSVLPLATWRPRALVVARELLARALGLGDLRLAVVLPSGHVGTLMPTRMFLIEHASAVLEGVDLGVPTHLRQNPRIGTNALPARGVLAVGQAAMRIADRSEYERTRAAAAPTAEGMASGHPS